MQKLHARLADDQQVSIDVSAGLTTEEIKRVATEVYGFKTVSEFLRCGLRYLITNQPVMDHAPKRGNNANA